RPLDSSTTELVHAHSLTDGSILDFHPPRPIPRPSLFFNDPPTTETYTLSLHDALPICGSVPSPGADNLRYGGNTSCVQVALSDRSEEHTSELQSPYDLVCRLLLEKKRRQQRRGCRRRLAHGERPRGNAFRHLHDRQAQV